MIGSSGSPPTLVIDANACVWSVLYPAVGRDVSQRFTRWIEDGRTLCAPALWLAETASAVRASVHQRLITPEFGQQSVDALLAMGVVILPLGVEMTRAAYRWAERLEQRSAYDGFYLAAAEASRGELWTADERLANAARAVGADWAHWIGEAI